ncbi:hypothetical protein BCF11_3367 [Collimonas sp. PA-H2]|uniref:hypothetical protein n=1 Tax=Collimonas sp. PA-H2 TaxID=1881062 RepID=UPI000BF34B6C|nr:hypothetical protein [Collimonas sp. PA-H2]PFH10932.1 hypothetical protein BCF11_3367 [Collimonas sp. PA-H2]
MIESLSDIEALAIRCHSEQSKGYIAEAIRCYRAGACRAAIVSTWIAIVFDLIDKIRELAVSGDKAAKDIETRYETYIAQIEQNNPVGIRSALEFERDILEICKDQLQFFDPQQFIDLTRLREDRHRCAHPSFQRVGIPYHPSAEQARLHIRNAVVHVLAQPPVQGKAALAQLKALVGSVYFPTDDEKALAQLDNSSLKNATDALVKGFIDMLIFGFLSDNDPLFYKPQVNAAINASFELYPGIVEDRLRKQLNTAIRDVPDNRFSGACCLVAFIKPAWHVLEQTSKNKVIRFIEEGPANEVLGGFEPLSKLDALKSAIELRINGLEFDDLANAINAHGVRALAKERSLHFLSQVGSWDRANEVFNKAVLPLFSHLSPEDIVRIVRMPSETGADLPGAHSYGLFIEKVRQAANIDNNSLNILLKENRGSYLIPQVEAE